MKKLLFLLLIMLGSAVASKAQISPQIQGAGAPSNPCANGGQQYVDTTNHVIYLCPSNGSNWVNIGPGNVQQPVQHGAGAPSPTSCSQGTLYTNDSNGNFYTCNTGTWGLATGGGSGTVSGQVAHSIPVASAATALTVQACTPPATVGTFTFEYVLASAAAVDPTCPQVGLAARSDVATSGSPIVAADTAAGDVVYAAAMAAAVTVPTPTTLANSNPIFATDNNLTAGAVTFTPTTLTVNGGATLVMQQKQRCLWLINPASATDWFAPCVDRAGYINGTAFAGTSTHLVAFGAANIPVDSGIVDTAVGLLAACTGCAPLASPTFTGTVTVPNLTCGVLNTTACIITGYGSTSGTATITWPAVAGTSTNPLTFSNVQLGPIGAAATPTYSFTAHANNGLYYNANGYIVMSVGGDQQAWDSSGTTLLSSGVFHWLNGTITGAYDTGFSRESAGIVDVGTGAQGSTAGTLKASQLVSTVTTGTAPLTVTSTTTVPNLTVSNHPKVQFCGTTTTCSHTAETSGQVVFGSAALVSGTPSTAAVTGISPAFTATGDYVCTVTGQTGAATDLLSVSNVSASAFTITGPATDTRVVNYICVGF